MVKKNRRKLKTGFTTGTAAAASAKGALSLILSGRYSLGVEIELPAGNVIYIPFQTCRLKGGKTAECTVIKDAGDDPDITHKAVIGARITILDNCSLDNNNSLNIIIAGGKGVGKVTKPGLEIPPGEPAINPVPREMIIRAVRDVLDRHNKRMQVKVEVFVPEGEKLSKKTLNTRLGIIGGISILGTTGLVKPMSHEAYTSTIKSSISVAHAMGVEKIVMTTGRRSERYARKIWNQLPEESFIQIGDFFKMSIETAQEIGINNIMLAVFFGKAVKMAQGIPCTHASRSNLSMQKLSEWSYKITKKRSFAQEILSANTARHAFDIIADKYPAVISEVGKRMVETAKEFSNKNDNEIRGIIFDYNGSIIFDSKNQILGQNKAKWMENVKRQT
ncbi:MAG TPA: cobalt-precorrin-5B (C(1))-methyltransferase [Desulfobacteraceae bacterium]|nr:cobalt-precorrin-5B (C(1))-methyltransferase [Desulfobacteraceae bacterium]